MIKITLGILLILLVNGVISGDLYFNSSKQKYLLCGLRNCKTCSSDGINCLNCNPGYGPDSSNTCSVCKPSYCSDCSTSLETCKTCHLGYSLIKNECIKCPNFCSKCTSTNVCTECIKGFTYHTESGICQRNISGECQVYD